MKKIDKYDVYRKSTGHSSGAFFWGHPFFLLTVNPDGIKLSFVRSELLIEIIIFRITAP